MVEPRRDPSIVSAVMRRVRSVDTAPEMALRRELHRRGLRYRVHDNGLPGKPDLVFRTARLAVFIDGDFWHGWRFPLWKHRLPSFWRRKIASNRERDLRNLRKLARRGWKVVRIWEHQVEKDALQCLSRIARALGSEGVDWGEIAAAYAELPRLKRRNRLPRP